MAATVDNVNSTNPNSATFESLPDGQGFSLSGTNYFKVNPTGTAKNALNRANWQLTTFGNSDVVQAHNDEIDRVPF